jgi:hypothetical protein
MHQQMAATRLAPWRGPLQGEGALGRDPQEIVEGLKMTLLTVNAGSSSIRLALAAAQAQRLVDSIALYQAL